MDSLSQIVLGASVAELALGKKIGRKASLYGSILGTLPDLDVLWVKTAVENFTEHRSFSHSLIVLLFISPLFAYLLNRFHRHKYSFFYWVFAVYAVFATHALLDWFTVYGTQLAWPFSQYPFGLNSMFIIDPLYTLPLLITLLITLFARNRAVVFGLVVSCAYLLWSLGAQAWQSEKMAQALNAKGIIANKVMTIPMPLNTFLWRQISMVDDGYWVSYSSVFDAKETPLQAKFFKSDVRALNSTMPQLSQSNQAVERLKYFTKGFYNVSQNPRNGIYFSDLRMGGFGRFVFTFQIAEYDRAQNSFQLIEPKLVKDRGDRESMLITLKAMLKRIGDPSVDLFGYYRGEL